VNFIYRLVKYGGAKRVLFLVDRGNLGEQTLKEFQQFVSPVNQYKFTEEYIVQHLTSNHLDSSARVVIGTIQRVFSMLKGEKEPAPDLDDLPLDAAGPLFKEPEPIRYNPEFPIKEFDFIVTDECHRSIYNLWRQVLEYFDASLIGLTATPSKQTFGFFQKNLVMEYNHEKAVADGVNVGCDVYEIKTQISTAGSRVESGYYVDKRDRKTRAVRWEQLDEEFSYEASELDRTVVAPDQIRTVLSTFRDRVFTEIFPGRTDLPKTLIFAKDDAHADDIVRLCREVFGKGNDFCKKITYKTTGEAPKELIKAFRNSYNPRIAVTVDMIATGTDIKPLEIVFFMRNVASKNFFDQMKGRGVRVVSETEMENVNPGVKRKTRFVIVDAVGVCERCKTETRPLDSKPSVSFEKLLDAAAFNTTETAAIESLATRLIRLERRMDAEVMQQVTEVAKGQTLSHIARGLLDALDADKVAEASRLLMLEEQRRDAAATAATLSYFDPAAPVDFLSGDLPHWRQQGTTYFVTFRFADSLPQEKLRQWREERDQWILSHPEPLDEPSRREYYSCSRSACSTGLMPVPAPALWLCRRSRPWWKARYAILMASATGWMTWSSPQTMFTFWSRRWEIMSCPASCTHGSPSRRMKSSRPTVAEPSRLCTLRTTLSGRRNPSTTSCVARPAWKNFATTFVITLAHKVAAASRRYLTTSPRRNSGGTPLPL